MNCRAVKRQLSALLDGELPERKRALCLSHLERCPECRRIYGQLLRLREAAAVPETLPEGLSERILESVLRAGGAEEPRAHRRRLWPASVALGAAMGLALCFWAVRGLPVASDVSSEPVKNGVAETSLFSQEGATREKNAEMFTDVADRAERALIEEYDQIYLVNLEAGESLEQAEDAGFEWKLTVEGRNYLVGDAALLAQLPYQGLTNLKAVPGECLLIAITAG